MNLHPDDRPQPTEQPIRARVPDHVAAGAFSTGVIVMTANTEFILDFVQNLGRPHQIIARVVMPHHVLPQLIDALQRNIDLYRKRWGELPQTGAPAVAQLPWSQATAEAQRSSEVPGTGQQIVGGPVSLDPPAANDSNPSGPTSNGNSTPNSGAAAGGATSNLGSAGASPSSPEASESGGTGAASEGSHSSEDKGGFQGRQTTAQDIYDDLKIRDEILSGSYSNAVMIGHGPHEFSFDFITNFYPHSSVSARVFLAAGQIPRLFDSLRGTYEQLRARQSQQPPGGFSAPPGYPPSGNQPGSQPPGPAQGGSAPDDGDESEDDYEDPIA